MRLGLRLFLGFFLIVGLAAFFVIRVFVNEVKPGVRQAMESTLVDAANVLAVMAADDLKAGRLAQGHFARDLAQARSRELNATVWQFPKQRIDYRVSITDARGIVVYDSEGRDVGRDNSHWNDVYRTLRGEYGARSSPELPGVETRTVMHVAAPIRDGAVPGQGAIIGVLTVSKPNQAMAPFIARSQAVIVRWGLVLLGSALVVGLLAAWWLSRQLDGLRRYADAVTAGERATLPDSAGEFAELGQALATMRARLDGKQYVEQYVHALTHELKSPLAAIRAAGELLETPLPEADRIRFAASVGAQSERMTQMVDALLALAAVEHRQALEAPTTLDLGVLAEEAVAAAAPRLRVAGVECELRRDAPLPDVCGEAFLLRQVVANLLDNAVDFSARGGVIDVELAPESGGVRITIADRGPGVPAFAEARVFERFFSLARPGDGARSSGLGLPFVAEVAALHGGRASLRNRDGGGAIAEVWLPAAPAD